MDRETISITCILPETRAWRRPRCDAEVGDMTAYYRDRAGRDHRCDLTAMYDVNGAKLCERHAGKRLINLMLVRPARVDAR